MESIIIYRIYISMSVIAEALLFSPIFQSSNLA